MISLCIAALSVLTLPTQPKCCQFTQLQAAQNPPAALPMLALGETDLLVARQFCTGLDPAWLDNVSAIGTTVIMGRLTMLVLIDAQNNWHVRYQDFSVVSQPGAAGDYAAMQAALADKRFEVYRCLKFHELPPQLGACPRPCDWTEIKGTISMLPDGIDKDRLLEVCGQSISKMPDIELAQLLDEPQVGEWAAADVGRYLSAQNSRLANATKLEDAPAPNAQYLGEFFRQLGGVRGNDVLYATATTTVGPDSVSMFDVGDVVKLFVKGDASRAVSLSSGRLCYRVSDLQEDAASGKIAVGAGKAGSLDIVRLDPAHLWKLAPVNITPATITKEAYVVLFDDKNFGDRRLTLRYPQGSADLDIVQSDDGKMGFGDKASSARWLIPKGWRVVLFKDKGFAGESYKLRGTGKEESIADLGGFGDDASSARWEADK